MSDTESESALELGSRLTASSLSPTLPGDAEPLKPVDKASEPRGNLLKKQSESRLVGLQREDSVVRFAGEVSPAKTETPSRRPSSGHVRGACDIAYRCAPRRRGEARSTCDM